MKHITPITMVRADALASFWNAIWRAWNDFLCEKKNALV